MEMLIPYQSKLQGDKNITIKVLNEIEKTVKFLEEDPFVSSIEVLEGKKQ